MYALRAALLKPAAPQWLLEACLKEEVVWSPNPRIQPLGFSHTLLIWYMCTSPALMVLSLPPVVDFDSDSYQVTEAGTSVQLCLTLLDNATTTYSFNVTIMADPGTC